MLSTEQLPPRHRVVPAEVFEAIGRRMCGRLQMWEAWLRHESEKLGLPFVRYRDPFPTWTLRELGYRKGAK
jgi:hypothetical protein